MAKNKPSLRTDPQPNYAYQTAPLSWVNIGHQNKNNTQRQFMENPWVLPEFIAPTLHRAPIQKQAEWRCVRCGKIGHMAEQRRGRRWRERLRSIRKSCWEHWRKGRSDECVEVVSKRGDFGGADWHAAAKISIFDDVAQRLESRINNLCEGNGQ